MDMETQKNTQELDFNVYNRDYPSLKSHSKPKIKWTKHQDLQLLRSIQQYGYSNWTLIASFVEGRNGKQCRERWLNHHNPSLYKGVFTAEEDEIILSQQKIRGNDWSSIAQLLPGRSANHVKNRFRVLLNKMKKEEKEKEKIFSFLSNDPLKYVDSIWRDENGIFSIPRLHE